VYSFFTRNLQVLASDLIQLLEKSNQWVDPNLLQCVAKTPPNKARRKKKRAVEPIEEEANDSDEFEGLMANRIALKRSKAVSDTSDDESGSEVDLKPGSKDVEKNRVSQF
jgi:hypothetical protein